VRTRDALKKLDLLLELNPELYTMCNFRRSILLSLWSPAPVAAASSAPEEHVGASTQEEAEAEAERLRLMRAADLDAELELSTRVITKDYKVYSAWVHRKWIIEHLAPQRQKEVLLGENKKCEMLLKLDERNFHVWGYRRWVTQLLATVHGAFHWEQDWAFAKAKIDHNFSNYSAWHNRALVLGDRLNAEILTPAAGGTTADASLLEAACVTLAAAITDDIALVERAFYADPNDQSAWFYVRFLLSLLKQLTGVRGAYVASVQTVRRACLDLQAEAAGEAVPYWALLTLRLLHGSHGEALVEAAALDDADAAVASGSPAGSEAATAELAALIACDPQRRGYYADLLQRLAAAA
jgi:hypothetical protein